jgi:ADP-ribosylglycohydrolase
MRISTSGCFGFWDESLVQEIAFRFGVATHPDPRCVFCTIAVALLICRYIQKRSGLRADVDIDSTLHEAFSIVPGVDEHRAVIEKYCGVTTVEELQLSGNNTIGYCLKAFGCGLWAVRYAVSFEDGISKIVREGGDADTNASVVGALLGAKFGFEGIRKDFVDFMFVGQWIWREITPYLTLMGLPVPPSPYHH